MRVLPENIIPDRYLGKGTELIYLFIIFALIVICSVFAIHEFTQIEISAIGAVGAFLGGVLGPLFALLVGVFTFLAFYVQFVANRKIQEQFEVQQFENQFYKMLDLHKANVDELKIPYIERFSKKIQILNEDDVDAELDSRLRYVEGRKAFVDMVEEFHDILTQVLWDSRRSNYKDSVKWHYAYKIFFWGLYSDFANSNDLNKEDKDQIKSHLGAQQLFFKKDSEEGKRNRLKPRFVPYQGHESHLAHYYRHLFQTVKYVVRTKEAGVINYKQARQYLRILRAQLSNAEQQMLYYNYICGFGKEWDRLGKRNNRFFTRYRMIHNIPVDRVKHVENPRDHFKEFICEKCTEEDPLFEWGDERKKLGCI